MLNNQMCLVKINHFLLYSNSLYLHKAVCNKDDHLQSFSIINYIKMKNLFPEY